MAYPVRVWLDSELRLMHATQDCPSAKMARKYGYQKSRLVKTVEEARILDIQYKGCELCKKKAR